MLKQAYFSLMAMAMWLSLSTGDLYNMCGENDFKNSKTSFGLTATGPNCGSKTSTNCSCSIKTKPLQTFVTFSIKKSVSCGCKRNTDDLLTIRGVFVPNSVVRYSNTYTVYIKQLELSLTMVSSCNTSYIINFSTENGNFIQVNCSGSLKQKTTGVVQQFPTTAANSGLPNEAVQTSPNTNFFLPTSPQDEFFLGPISEEDYDNEDPKDYPNTGRTIGIAVGVGVGALLIGVIVVIVIIVRRRSKLSQSKSSKDGSKNEAVSDLCENSNSTPISPTAPYEDLHSQPETKHPYTPVYFSGASAPSLDTNRFYDNTEGGDNENFHPSNLTEGRILGNTVDYDNFQHVQENDQTLIENELYGK